MGNLYDLEHLTTRRQDLTHQVVRIERLVRRMRGGSQSYLIQGHNGEFYVAKFMGNPQGNRTLINEWISTQLLAKIGVSTPSLAFLAYDASTVTETPFFTIGTREIPVVNGLHLGSLCPVNPDKQAIFDFLPHKLLQKTVNLEDFAAMLVMDTFLGQADRRQAIFVRARSGKELSFRAYFIDHGMVFGGSSWHFQNSKTDHFYFDRVIYSTIAIDSLCERTLEQIETFTDTDLNDAATGLPPAWFASGDRDALVSLYSSLKIRKARLRSLIADQLESLHARTCCCLA
jgi:hypothetical protein